MEEQFPPSQTSESTGAQERNFEVEKCEVKEESFQDVPEVESSKTPSQYEVFQSSNSTKAQVEAIESNHWKNVLTEKQRAEFRTLPDSVRCEIGLKLKGSDRGKERFVQFFERYLQRDRQTHSESDYYFETKPAQMQMTGSSTGYKVNGFQTRICTSALYNRSFVGTVFTNKEGAENSACLIFFLDEEVSRIKEKLVPASKKVQLYVANKIFGSETKKRLVEHGFILKTVIEEAKQELFSLLRAEGCRSALWDGNA